jgi:hypothetical protein
VQARNMIGLNAATNGTEGERRWDAWGYTPLREREHTVPKALLAENIFASMLYLERRRAERARKRFVLVLIDISDSVSGDWNKAGMAAFGAALSETTRETDIVGWYLEDNLVGVIGTDLGAASDQVVREKFMEKIQKVFEETLGLQKGAKVSASFHFFPEEAGEQGGDHSANITLYPELKKKEDQQRISLAIKRGILRNSRAWAVWLDLKTLLRTPAAVIRNKRAY